jgi:hypothetical protein
MRSIDMIGEALIGIGIAAWVGYSAIAGAHRQAVPDDFLTPGDIATSDPNVICQPGYSRSQRLYEADLPAYRALRRAVLDRYGIAAADRQKFTLDDRIPLCLGGRQSPRNVWPEPFWEAVDKDRIEVTACRAACAVHTRAAVEHWQRKFLGDWRAIRP